MTGFTTRPRVEAGRIFERCAMPLDTLAPPIDRVAARGSRPWPEPGVPETWWSEPVGKPTSEETDALTGLCNRQGLTRRLAERLEAARRNGEIGAVIFCDLEAYGVIGERFGPAASDAALRVAGEAIAQVVRGIDAVGRIEGGCFAVLLGRVAADQALAIAARISTEVRGRRLTWNDFVLPVAVSVGITTFTGAEEAEALLARAGTAARASDAA
jgi:diguanylate cyclase (GGDEF)-like protein